MKVIDKNTTYNFEDVLSLACRENNNKRSFIFVNKLQGKHIPCKPSETIKFVGELGDLVKKGTYGKAGVIAFAETATAIGAIVADKIGKDTYYMTTTRLEFNREQKILFKEEHSHAPKQILYYDKSELNSLDTLVMVDDEYTTCKTVLNCIKELKEKDLIKKNTKIVIASLSNCLNDARYTEVEAMGYKLVYLFRFEKSYKDDSLDTKMGLQRNVAHNSYEMNNNNTIRVPLGFVEPRLGCYIEEYNKNIDKVVSSIKGKLGSYKQVLVLGTEEYMYPAIRIGRELENVYESVVTQSTTRSPIVTSTDTDYPLKSRVEFESIYNSNIKTYLYNLKQYDKVIIVTDSRRVINGSNTLIRRLMEYQNKDITIIRLENTYGKDMDE